MKSAISLVIGFILLLISAYYGFASAEEYGSILKICIGFSVLAIIFQTYALLKSTGIKKWISIALLLLTFLVSVQAVIRIFK